MLSYSPFWFGVLIGIGVMFISLAILFGLKIAYSEEGIIIEQNKPELKCMYYSDGKLAVVRTYPCIGYESTISWFLSKGYHIAGTSNPSDWNVNELFLVR